MTLGHAPSSSPRRRAALPLACALVAVLVAAIGELHARYIERQSPHAIEARQRTLLDAVEARKERLTADLEQAAAQAAALPTLAPAIEGDAAARTALFTTLDQLAAAQAKHEDGLTLAVYGPGLTPVAWTGRGPELRGLEAAGGGRKDTIVLVGSVTTTLVATAPVQVRGRPVGLAAATVPVKVQRNIRNRYLSDFDRLAQGEPGLEIEYLDSRAETPDEDDDEPAPAGTLRAALTVPGGRTIAVARVSAVGVGEEPERLRHVYRRVAAGLVWLTVLAWAATARRTSSGTRLLLGLVALRLVTLLVGWPLPDPASSLASPDTYASALLGPLLKTPLDLLLTAAMALVAAGLLARRAAALAPARFRPGGAVVGAVLSLPLLAGLFAWISDTCANSTLDLEAMTVLPRSAAHAVLQLGLLCVLVTGLLLIAAAFSLAGPFPSTRRARLGLFLGAIAFGSAAYASWPRSLSLPLLPAVGVVLCGASLALFRPWLAAVTARGPEQRGGLVLAAVGGLAALLYPSLVHYGEKAVRLQIEHDHAPLILRQPQWRAFVLGEAQRRVDALRLLEDAPERGTPTGLDELAFATWSATDLAGLGFSSAVEIQDASGVVISRFALDLPASEARRLPAEAEWRVGPERLRFASVERPVLHAQRRLEYHGETHGAVHLYLADDVWNLPFVPSRDPYSLLFRSSAGPSYRERPVELLVYDASGRVAFSSAERPPALASALGRRMQPGARGFWTTLAVDARPHHTFLFSDGRSTFGLAYPRIDADRYAAGLVDAFAALLVVLLLGLLAVLAIRSALHRDRLTLGSVLLAVRRRFTLRLFVALVAVAIIPVAVLEGVVRRFVADRLHRELEDQALERAAVARRVVEDYVFYQRGEAAGLLPVTDPVLVWAASLIRTDLDVFGRGQLLASSKRELYASGLLLPRAPGAVYRALTLEQAPAATSTERIGSFSTPVVSVPVKLAANESGILSIPLALRQQEIQATLDDLDRNIRLASVAFLLFAAALAHSMSRRISGPIRDLTEATRRVAAGDLEARVGTSAQDEVKALVDAFNQMAGDLDRQRRDLERSNRLAAWAEMARQVAHDVKNPLTPIQLSAEHLRRVYGDPAVDFDQTLAACTDTILRQVGALRQLVTEFSAFARPPGPALEAQDLEPIVRGAVEPYLAGLPPGVALEVEVEGRPAPVRIDRRLFERAVLNLLENALQAVGERGRIMVRLQENGGQVELEVEDSGPGLDPEALSRAFQPFFSTKTSGSGLGLALVKKIAEDHGGSVALESPPAGPTRAHLSLPAATVETPAAAQTGSPPR